MSSEQGPEQAGGAPAGPAGPPVGPMRTNGLRPAPSSQGNGSGPGGAGDSAAQPGEASAAAGAGVPSERKVFRLQGALIAWWVWVAFAVANLVDLAITGRDHTAAEIAVSLIVITGLVYACALRPRVVADAGGITVMNPFRDHQVPWGSVTSVDLAESVRVHCAPEPGAKSPKVIHSWALFTQRRNKLRQEIYGMGGSRRRMGRTYTPTSYGQMPPEARKIAEEPAAKLMARQLNEMAATAREHGAPGGPRVVHLPWQPLVAIGVPLLAAVLVFIL
ncbi:MAG TPA: PH domain-containing protein [Streptosporangiaceae bacterium]